MQNIEKIINKYYDKNKIYIDKDKKVSRSLIIKSFKSHYNRYKKNLSTYLSDEENFDNIFFKSLDNLFAQYIEGEDLSKVFYKTFNTKLSQNKSKSGLTTTNYLFAIHSREIEEIAAKFPPYEEQIYDPYDPKNREKLILQNLKLALKLALKYSRKTSESLLDILQCGYEGLVKAYDTYSPNKATKFSTFARFSIIGEIMIYLTNDTRTVRIQKSDLDKIKKETDHYPSNNSESFFTKASDVNLGSNNMIIDVIGKEDDNMEEIKREQEMFTLVFDSLLSNLNTRNKQLIRDYYGLGYRKKLSKPELSKKYNLKKNEVENEVKKIHTKLNKQVDNIEELINLTNLK